MTELVHLLLHHAHALASISKLADSAEQGLQAAALATVVVGLVRNGWSRHRVTNRTLRNNLHFVLM
jgi:hypothetical protein